MTLSRTPRRGVSKRVSKQSQKKILIIVVTIVYGGLCFCAGTAFGIHIGLDDTASPCVGNRVLLHQRPQSKEADEGTGSLVRNGSNRRGVDKEYGEAKKVGENRPLEANADNAQIVARNGQSDAGQNPIHKLRIGHLAKKPDHKRMAKPIAPEPNVGSLMKRLRDALAPFQTRYLLSIGESVKGCDLKAWSGPIAGFLWGCYDGCRSFTTLAEAKKHCESGGGKCGGVVQTVDNRFELREGHRPEKSDGGEIAYVMGECGKDASAVAVWDTFRETIENAISDEEELHLSTTFPTREDDTIYLSISSYRDETCRHTVAGAFREAKHPERLFVGIVQQNCNVQNCMTGVGWGNNREWVPQNHPDTDCIEQFCVDNPKTCARQVRILRLGERESYGPFFGRYLSSKLYRGENFLLQIDAHTKFRRHWDAALIDQMHKTPSYPYSIISNYPPSGDPKDTKIWPAPTGFTDGSSPPPALCGCTFESAGGSEAKHMTVRLAGTNRKFENTVDPTRPHHSAFVAAGFMIAHGSVVNNVPYDPFLPFLFMGEEISMSVRFWTSGYDIYAPAQDVVSHEYVRKHGPKFWESIQMVFSSGSLHNDLTDLIIPRVQRLVGWKDNPAETESVLTQSESFSNGDVRTAEQFLQTMNIQKMSLKQSPPDWCLKGLDMPQSLPKRVN